MSEIFPRIALATCAVWTGCAWGGAEWLLPPEEPDPRPRWTADAGPPRDAYVPPRPADAGPPRADDAGPPAPRPRDAGPPEPSDAGEAPSDAGPTDPPDAGPTDPPDAGPAVTPCCGETCMTRATVSECPWATPDVCRSGSFCTRTRSGTSGSCLLCERGSQCTLTYEGAGRVVVDCVAATACTVRATSATCCVVFCGASCTVAPGCAAVCGDGSPATPMGGDRYACP